eukprot:CAMPEP_0204322800 /NCGR_PEP_ID=MMETSP0469-20131031/8914_1 /ASSEMBLY_ACC=CAM_ASM_000384 /TAXON_ID=2969 /ORGANISM="Oxyrrhis marina" /LENGTH=53 /DNA_ID=CAMNT_0051304177 /DNA_START=21 /DNA_END=179 /DNA_ORIENTATION=-
MAPKRAASRSSSQPKGKAKAKAKAKKKAAPVTGAEAERLVQAATSLPALQDAV